MKAMKKMVAFGLMAFMLASLVGCGSSAANHETSNNGKQENSVTSQQTENNSDTPNQATTESEVQSTEESEPFENSASNILVVYFSRTGEQYTVGVIDKGNTAIVAEMIADKAGADLWEVLPAEDIYPTDSYERVNLLGRTSAGSGYLLYRLCGLKISLFVLNPLTPKAQVTAPLCATYA